MRMGLLENWDEIQDEFDLWEKTITNTFRISIGLVIIGFVSTILITLFTTFGAYSILFMVGFVIASLVYSYGIGDRKIQAHQDRIHELAE